MQLPEVNWNILCAISKKRAESKTCIMKRALSLYSVIEARMERGENIFIGTDQHKAELVMIL
jgi:hypothetical protein